MKRKIVRSIDYPTAQRERKSLVVNFVVCVVDSVSSKVRVKVLIFYDTHTHPSS